MKRNLLLLTRTIVLMLLVVAIASCDKIDNKSLPVYPVRLNLGDFARWNTYGVNGVGSWRIFNRDKRIPANFPYDVNTYTGYGGVLLIVGSDNVPQAFDAACPVEGRADVTVTVNDKMEAVCPTCGSRYNVLTPGGTTLSGPAINRKVGLSVYHVRQSVNGGYIITSY